MHGEPTPPRVWSEFFYFLVAHGLSAAACINHSLVSWLVVVRGW